jgi:hypothetical protein
LLVAKTAAKGWTVRFAAMIHHLWRLLSRGQENFADADAEADL